MLRSVFDASPTAYCAASSRGRSLALSHRTRELWQKTSYFAKESALPARKQDLFSIPQKKNEASIFEETRLHHLAEIDDTITAGPKEH